MRVLKRFPTYDFTFRTHHAPLAAASALDSFFAHQERPRGFVLTDSRIDGRVSGSTFEFRRRKSGFGGSASVYVEGYFIPAEGGADVIVRVRLPVWLWLFDIAFLLFALTNVAFPPSVAGAATMVSLGAFTLLLSAGLCMYEGKASAALLLRVMGETLDY